MKKLLAIIVLLAASSCLFAGELGDVYFHREYSPIGVHRWFETAPTPADFVKAVMMGPNGDELEDGLFTAVPADWVLDGVTENGAYLDINIKPLPEGTLYTTGQIEDIWVQFDNTIRYKFGLMPRIFIDGEPLESYEMPVPDFSCDKPFVPKNERIKSAASGVLSGKLIAVRGGHGWAYDTSRGTWVTERGDNCSQYITREDFHTLDLTNILITYLEQEGASIVHCRESNKNRGDCSYSGKPWWQMSPIAYMADAGYPSDLYGGSPRTDVSQSRYAASNLANYRGADLYLSIHTNALNGDCYSNCGTGLEAFYSTNNSASNSQRIAQLCVDNCINMVRTYYDGSFACRHSCAAVDANYAETRRATMPSTLFEFGFHDNCAKDAKYLGDNFFRTVGMYGIAQAVFAYYGVTPKYGPYSAEYVSDTIPTQVNAGETRQVSITFKNHGLCWQSGRNFKLGSPGNSDPFAAARQELPGEVMPGDTVTFTFNMTFPAAAGTYTTDWQMMREDAAWFGDKLTKTVTVGTPERGAKYVSDTIPASATVGETKSVSVTFKNTGSTTWTKGTNFKLGAVEDSDPFTSTRKYLTKDVPTGQSVTFTFDMTFSTVGTFTTDWQMVQDGVGWFGDILTKNVKVSPVPTVYYIDFQNGNNSNAGTMAKPWKTIAGHENLTSGDQLLCQGTFSGQVDLTGTTGIYIGTYGSGATVSKAADSSTRGFYINGGSNVVIDGFTFNGLYRAVEVQGGAHDLTISNCRFVDIHTSGGGEGAAIWIENGYNVNVHHNYFRNVGQGPNEGCVITKANAGVNVYNNSFNNCWFATRNWGGDSCIQFKNNICQTVKTAVHHNSSNAGGSKRDYNIYWGCGAMTDSADLADGGHEKININPEMDSNGTISITSPAIDAGVNVGLPYTGNAPDIGWMESLTRDAKYVSDTIPATATLGETKTVTITFKNTGSLPWTIGNDEGRDFKLGAMDDGDPFATVGRVAVPSTVNPGQNATFTLTMKFNKIGTYTTDWKMLQEFVAWFGEGFSKQVTVTRPSAATTFYVNSSTGNDNNTGLTAGSAWKTITGNKSTLIAGDTVNVTGTFGATTFDGINGTAAKPITFRAYNGAVITAGNDNGKTGFLMKNSSNLVLQGFEFKNNFLGILFGGKVGAATGGCTNVRVTECDFHDNHLSGGSDEGAAIWVGNGSGTKIDHCRFKNNNVRLEGCIIVGNSLTGETYIYNNVFDGNKYGIRVWGQDQPVRVANNIFMGNTGSALYSDRGSGSTHLYNNCFHNNTKIYDCDISELRNSWTDHGGNLQVNPTFDDASSYQLAADSPLIDAGVDVGFEYFSTAPDIGWYESRYEAQCVISGTVKNSSGAAVSGATVAAGDSTATTGSDGKYNLSVTRGSSAVTLTVTASGYNSATAGVIPSGATATKDFTLTLATCIVSGTVTSSYGGGAVSGATVKVGTATATTGSDGKYSVTVNRANSYAVTVTAAGYAGYSGTVAAAGATATKNITLTAKCVISGNVKDNHTGSAISGATVKVGAATVTTGSDGKYSVTVDRSGTALAVTASAAGYDSITVSVTPNAAAVTKHFNLVGKCVLHGYAESNSDVGGGRIAGATVTVEGTSYSAVTGSDGAYTMTIPRIYTPVSVTVAAEGYESRRATNVDLSGADRELNFSDVKAVCRIY
ncbi:MAG: carboxypeptidase regulatory-like domain-containing protein, partial [Abditibacteriota bacterium]|nr:carboxypeptidase regulatory-like domain-containing protein [Abditibacteriota bacterium]